MYYSIHAKACILQLKINKYKRIICASYVGNVFCVDQVEWNEGKRFFSFIEIFHVEIRSKIVVSVIISLSVAK